MSARLPLCLLLAAAALAGCAPTQAEPANNALPPDGSSSGGSSSSGGQVPPPAVGLGGQCAACQADADCGEEGSALCVFESNLPTGHCAPACSSSSDCETGAVCTSTSANVTVCYPATQTCDGWTTPAPSGSGGTGTGITGPLSGSSSSSTTTSGTSSGGTTGGSSTTTSSSGTTTSTSGGSSSSCPGYADPNTPAGCTCASGHTCTANNCYGGWYCDLATSRCVAPPTSCGGSTTTTGGTTTGGTTTGGTTTGGTTTGGTTTGTAGPVGPQGGSVNLLHFGMSGDTRPPSCEDTAGYPSAIINAIGDAERAAGAQFALDLGDHMYVCNNDASVAQAQMSLFMQGVAHFGGTWFMTEGNHECMGSGSGYCPTGSTNVNYQAFLGALSGISNTPYYSVNVQTSKGLATFVFIADNSWDSAQQSWLEQTLATADANATYTIVAKHHPTGDTSVAANSQIIQIIRSHKFALLLTGHAHKYEHPTTDSGRDLILGNGGAPLISSGTFNGYAMVDQLSNGNLQVTVFDVQTGAPQDQWQVGPN